MAQPISNTVTNNSGGFPGLLAAPKTQTAAPINFGALNLSSPTSATAQKPASVTPATQQSGINYNLPTPTLVNNLAPTGGGAATQQAAPIAKAAAPVTPPANTQTPPATGAAPATTTTPPAGTANGTVTGTTPGLFPTVASSLANPQPNPGYTQNIALYNQLAQQAQTVASQGANLEAGQRTTGTSPVAEGNAAVTAQTVAAETGAIGTQEQAALTAAGLGQTQQNLNQQAQTTAATLTQPSSAGFPFTYDPATNSFNVSGGNLNSAISTGVQQAIQNPTLYSSLLSAVQSTYGAASAGMFQQAYIAAGGNPSVAAGQSTGAQAVAAAAGQTEAANIQTAGTAGTQAASTAYQSGVQAVAAANKSYTALTGVSSQLNDTLANWGNTGVITNYNAALNSIAGVTSNPNYQQFVVALGNTQAAYQSALGSAGVTPSKADVDALNALNPSSSATAINAALNQLSKDAHALLVVPAYQQQQTYGAQLGI